MVYSVAAVSSEISSVAVVEAAVVVVVVVVVDEVVFVVVDVVVVVVEDVVVEAAYCKASILYELMGLVSSGLTRLSAVRKTIKTEHKTADIGNIGFPKKCLIKEKKKFFINVLVFEILILIHYIIIFCFWQ